MQSIRVLHVEDDPGYAEIVAEFLNREDERLAVLTEHDGPAGLERLAEETVDCVVSDYDMPRMNGLEFLEAVRADHPDLPFVLYTGKGSEEVASEAMSAGATDYLQKGGGAEQYELLANRITNAAEQYRSRRQAAEHERVSRVVREVNRVLVRASSVEAIEQGVCDVLSDADPYVAACVADVDAGTTRIEPRAWGGAAGYFEELEMSVAEGAPGRDTPWGRAFHGREVAISQEIQTDPEYGKWRSAAADRGFQSLAVVPLAHQGDLYGLLAVFADRVSAFDATERDLLADLGDDVANALHAQRVRAEFEMTASRLEALFEDSPDMINIHDTEGNLLEPNRRLCERTGFTADQLRGMKVWDIDATLTPKRARELWEGMAPGDRRHIESEFRCADGSTFPVAVHVRRLGIDGEDRFVAISRDITDRRARERELERAKRRFEAVFNDPNLLAGILDPDGTLVEQNETALEYVDADRAEVLGRPFWETPWWPPEARATIEGYVRDAAGGEYVTYEMDLTDSDGDPYSVRGVIRPVTEEGEVVSLVVSALDITGRRARERTLKRQNERVEELADVVSHDLQTPLSTARGRAELAVETGDLKHVERAVTALERADELRTDLVEVLRTRAVVGETEPVDVGALAREAWTGVCTPSGAALHVEDPPRIAADRDALKRAVENLLSNAVEHGAAAGEPGTDSGTGRQTAREVAGRGGEEGDAGTGTGSVRVTVDALADGEGFSVADDGPGLPEGAGDDLFRPGFSTKPEGTGVGLASVREVVRAHGWEIAATESEAGGARFEIRGVDPVGESDRQGLDADPG